MKRINIMTWNTGMTEWNNSENKRYKQIEDYIIKHLKKEHSIVFVQQIPYKYKDEDAKWKEHDLFKELKKTFSEENGYYISCNNTYNNGYIVMMTIAIAVKDSIEPSNKQTYPKNTPTNRECAVWFNGLNILSIHAKNGKDNKGYLKSINGQADIILGDFNAGNYMESQNRFTFNNILKEHVCICNVPTRIDPSSKRRTCIDHIFIRENFVTRCSNMRVHEDIIFSDHFPLTFEMEFES